MKLKGKPKRQIVFSVSLIFLCTLFISLFNPELLVLASPEIGDLASLTNQSITSCSGEKANQIFLQAPVPAGLKFRVGGPQDWLGYFYGEGGHTDSDLYAIDINLNGVNGNPYSITDDKGIIITAAADGVIKEKIESRYGYGNYIVIQHPFGFQTRYAHLNEIFNDINVDEWVAQGTPLGTLGTIGNSTAPHLHFVVYYCDSNNCNSVQAACPEPLGEKNILIDGDKISSTNYGIGYAEVELNKDNSTDINKYNNVRHDAIINLYKELKIRLFDLPEPVEINKKVNDFGGLGLIGAPKGYVGKIGDLFVQEFTTNPYALDEWAKLYESAIIEIKNDQKAYFLAGPIWDNYRNDYLGKANNTLGLPIGNSYFYRKENNPQLGIRNDFENGSLLWNGDEVTELNEENAKWEAYFFNSTDFTNFVFKRRDETSNVQWERFKTEGFQQGTSISWKTTTRFVHIYKFDILKLQGYLKIKQDGKVIFEQNSPDQEISVNSNISFGLGNRLLEIEFWQEGNKPAVVDIGYSSNISQLLIDKAFAAGPSTIYGLDLAQPDMNVVIYDPPSFPGQEDPYKDLPATSSATILLLDSSGSMNETDITGYSKMTAAQRAAQSILDVVLSEKYAVGAYSHQVGLVDFNSQATVDSELTDNVDTVKAAIDRLYADGGTGMPDGLSASIDMLATVDNSLSKMVILLSDGLPNIGLSGDYSLENEQVMEQVLSLARTAGGEGICIYTIGLGIPDALGEVSGDYSMNEDFLKQVADESTCGAYYNAENAHQLASAFIEIRHAALGNLLSNEQGVILQGEEIDLGLINVQQNQDMVLFTLNWPGSQLKLIVTDPQGRVVDDDYSNASIYYADSLVSMVVSKPYVGDWHIVILGYDVPEGNTNYNFLLSSRAKPDEAISEVTSKSSNLRIPYGGALPVVVLLIMLAGFCIAFYTSKNRKRTEQTGINRAFLIGNSVNTIGQRISLSNKFLIGRGSMAHLILNSRNVSRTHAEIGFSAGIWYLRDLNSQNGTMLNGQEIRSLRLTSGDRITIGDYSWLFFVE